ncbi:demethylmenaquinone methyltransferase [Pycnococcus provasolii]
MTGMAHSLLPETETASSAPSSSCRASLSTSVNVYDVTDASAGFQLPGHTKLSFVSAMFDKIAPGYDTMNLLISLGQTSLWRYLCFRTILAQLVQLGCTSKGARVLDVGCGSGISTYALRRQCAPKLRVETTGVDPSPRMLEVARRNDPDGCYELGNAENLASSFGSDSFDAVYSVYTLRNFSDVRLAVRAMTRVLRPGGALVLLDAFPPPKGSFMQLALRFWMNVVVAGIVRVFAFADAKAYRYLASSIEQTRSAEETAEVLRDEGLKDVRVVNYTFGAAAMLVGVKR